MKEDLFAVECLFLVSQSLESHVAQLVLSAADPFIFVHPEQCVLTTHTHCLLGYVERALVRSALRGLYSVVVTK
jgi:hypothetical protein